MLASSVPIPCCEPDFKVEQPVHRPRHDGLCQGPFRPPFARSREIQAQPHRMVALVEMRNGAVSVSQVRDAWRKYPHVRRIAAAISQSQRVVPAERSRPCHILESEQPVSQLTYRAGKPQSTQVQELRTQVEPTDSVVSDASHRRRCGATPAFQQWHWMRSARRRRERTEVRCYPARIEPAASRN